MVATAELHRQGRNESIGVFHVNAPAARFYWWSSIGVEFGPLVPLFEDWRRAPWPYWIKRAAA